MVTTEKITIAYTQKWKSELKWLPAKNRLNMKEDGSAGNEGQESYKAWNSDRDRPLLVGNYFQCKQTKLSCQDKDRQNG